MKLIINKDRSVIPVGTWGTVNENNYEILDFEFPAELEEYNKRIVYYLGNQKVWDAIINNKAIITNAITTKGSVKAYIWCTKSDEAFETDVDFRTQIFVMNFFENDNADGIVPTPEQVDGFNTMLTAMNNKIAEVNALEQTIGAAESTRQTNETTRQTNEQTRQDNEATRQENEQTRQTQEADRERRTDEAIGKIEDLTEEYNQNAQQKTEAFNQNATNKTNDFNDNASSKKSDFNSNAESKTTTFNNNASSKTSDFNTNATNKTNAFDSNASSKTTAFNDNAASKTNTFNSNASSKTNEFNTNAENKTSAFNTNASDKTTAFDNNASSRTSDFNTNAESKTNTFNDNATQKTTDFNNNAQAKTEAFDEHTEEMQQEIDELSANMPWAETEQAIEIQVTDAAKYSRNKLELFGNTSQDSTTGKNLFDNSVERKNAYPGGDIGGQIAYVNSNATYSYVKCAYLEAGKTYTISWQQNIAPASENGRISRIIDENNINLASFISWLSNSNSISYTPNVSGYLVLATDINSTNIMIEEGSTATNYEPYTGGQPSPNPDYPQPIHVVTGNNTIGVQGKNLAKSFVNGNELGQYRWSLFVDGDFEVGKKYVISFIDKSVGNKYYRNESFMQNVANFGITITGDRQSYYFECKSNDKTNGNVYVTGKGFVIFKNNAVLEKLPQFEDVQIEEVESYNIPATDYVPYYHADYPINLGSLELCKIGDYQDYLYKENGNWYKYGAIRKYTQTNAVNFSLRRVRLVSSSDLHDMGTLENQVNLPTPLIINISTSSNSRYNYGWGGLGFVFSQEEMNMIGVEDATAFKNYLDENLVAYVVIKPKCDYIDITQITDETLISQLEAIYNHLALVKGTNHITITPSDLEPYVTLNYMQDLPSKLDNLDSRLSLLE